MDENNNNLYLLAGKAVAALNYLYDASGGAGVPPGDRMLLLVVEGKTPTEALWEVLEAGREALVLPRLRPSIHATVASEVAEVFESAYAALKKSSVDIAENLPTFQWGVGHNWFQGLKAPRRTILVRVRVSPEEKRDIELKAGMAGFRDNVSEYARRVALGEIPVSPVRAIAKGRGDHLVFKISPQEDKQLDAFCQREGLGKSSYIRNMLLGDMEGVTETRTKPVAKPYRKKVPARVDKVPAGWA